MLPNRDLRWVNGLNEDYLQCRSLRHAWQMERFSAVTADELEAIRTGPGRRLARQQAQLLRRDVICLRCTTMRVDYFGRNKTDKSFNRDFHKISSRYVYPKGYSFHTKEHEADRPMSTDYHRELFQRWNTPTGRPIATNA